MAIVGWVELIVIVGVLIFLGILYRVYWVRKRRLAAGLAFLILGSALCLFTASGSFVNLWMQIQRTGMPLQFSEYVSVAFAVAWITFWSSLGIYGLVTAVKALRVMGKRVLNYRVPNS